MSDYPVKRLRDAGVTLYDCEHKTPKPAKSGYPYIAIPNIQDGRLDLSDVRLITKEDFDYWTRKIKPQKGDVIVTRRGRVGDTAVVPGGLDCAIGQNLVILRSEGNEVEQNFLRWALRGPLYEEQVDKFLNVGAIFYSLNCADIPNFELPIPPLPEQRAIAGILGALDDKIELNRRMNQTLESMAQAVFRQWFVENERAGDWEVGTFGDVIINFDAKRVPVANRERAQRQGKYPYYGAASVMDYVDDYLFDGIYVLMGEDGSVVDDEGHPVTQYVWGKIWVNNHAHVLQGTNGICNEHLYLFLKEVNILPYITGAVQPKINQANMNSIPFVLPPMKLRKRFEEFVSPLFAKIRANNEESRTLASLRDTLLPKLMRGEVSVKDIEREM